MDKGLPLYPYRFFKIQASILSLNYLLIRVLTILTLDLLIILLCNASVLCINLIDQIVLCKVILHNTL